MWPQDRSSNSRPLEVTLSHDMGMLRQGSMGSKQQQQRSPSPGSARQSAQVVKQPSFGRYSIQSQRPGSSLTPTQTTSPRAIPGSPQRSSPSSLLNNNKGLADSIDKSMLPGHNQASLSAKLEATRAAFKASQASRSTDMSYGMYGRPSSGSHRPPSAQRGVRDSDPGPAVARREGERPRAFTCYLCGQQYGRTSLMIHIQQCQKKWVAVEAVKLARERRALPPPPACLAGLQELPSVGQAIDEFNAEMAAYWDKVSLMGCHICGRTFRPDAFERHQKVCTPDNPGGPLGMPKSGAAAARVANAKAKGGSPADGMGRGGGGGGGGNYSARPRAYVCYLCGQQYGSASLTIHIPACYKKWLEVEGKKDRKERREPPPPPPELDKPLPTEPNDIDAFNQKMSDIYNGVSLLKCQHCGRTMRPDALPRHQKLCTAEKPMKAGGQMAGSPAAGGQPRSTPASGSSNAAAQQLPSEYADAEQDLEACQHCGRTMRPEALLKHNRVCTAEKPMKSVARSTALTDKPPSAVTASKMQPDSQHPYVHAPTEPKSPGRPAPRVSKPSTPPPLADSQEYTSCQPDTPDVDPRGGYNPGYDLSGMDDSASQGMEDGRIQCSSCGRCFGEEAYEKHARVCAKVFANKRKPFNAAKQRLQGTDAAMSAGKLKPPSRPAAVAVSTAQPGTVPRWKAQSEGLRAAMANMRDVKAALARGEDIRNIPVVPSAPDPSLVQCPHCGRRFNEQAASRHIAACANTIAKPKFLKAGTGGSGKGAPQSKQLPRY